MKVVEIRQEVALQELRPAWEALLRESNSDTIFLTWEWVTTWWSSYGKPGKLRILAVFDEPGVLRGLAPLYCRTVRRYGQTVSALCFIGDGSNDSDYLDLILASGHEEEVVDAFRRHWAEQLRHGEVLLLNEIPETSRSLQLLRSLAQSQKANWTEVDVQCGAVHLPGEWEEYLRKLRPRFRTKIRSVLRDLEARPEVRFGFCENVEQVQSMLPVLFDLHARRWAQEGKPGVFGWDQKRTFYSALSVLFLERGWLRFSWLEWNGKVLACQYGFAYGGKYFLLQEGYEPASEHWNLGIGLRAWSIREFMKEGLREYDFLGGRLLRHRSDWGAEAKRSKQVQLAGKSYKNLVFCRGPEWSTRTREAMKPLIPEKLMELRRTRLERRNGSTTDSSRTEWMQKAAAHCYYMFHLPVLARPVREQYQLSISPNGRLPKFSWNRRMEPSARVLYYHRVNDEQDPFFPAISTELFEQEMRFVARHYRVVGLAELLDHLEGDSRETVVTITFDDGYQDNYLNAFPILQRYGIPGTIFLATGSVDSREPLWFDQLSQSVKMTAKDHIDLEIDLPRRFWMRTQAERLASNSAIYGLLRGLADTERQLWMARILRQLGVVCDKERRDRMLTWDQVRTMNAHGVEFGGHSVTHPFISRLTREQVAWEASECKQRIEQELQRPVDYFAYPSGREEDFGRWNKDLIRSAGYRAAMTTIWGMNYQSTDRMELRRGGPWEASPAEFAYKLDWYQLVND